MLGDGEAGAQLGDGQRGLVKKERRTFEMANPGDSLADSKPGPRRQLGRGRESRLQLMTIRARHELSQGAADPENPVVDHESDLLGQAVVEAEPHQVSPGELEAARGPHANGQKAAAGAAPDAADREDRAALFDPAKMAPAARLTAWSRQCEEDVDLPAHHPPDGLGIVQRQGTIADALLGLAVGRELVDQEPGRQPVAVGQGLRLVGRRGEDPPPVSGISQGAVPCHGKHLPASIWSRHRPSLDGRQPGRALLHCLPGDQACVLALRLPHQLLMSANLNGTTRAQHDDAIAIADGAQAVSNEQAGAATASEMVIDQGLGLGVQRACSLVQHQQARVAHQRPGDLQALPLTAGKIPGSLRHERVVTPESPQQILMDRGPQARLDQSAAGDELVPEGQVVSHGSLEHGDPLIDQGDRADEDLARDLADRLAVMQDLAAPGLVKTRDQAGQRRLAAARRADQGNSLAGMDDQREFLDDRLLHRAVVAEGDGAKLEAASQPRYVRARLPRAFVTPRLSAAKRAGARAPDRSCDGAHRRCGRDRPAAPEPRCPGGRDRGRVG